MAFTFNTTVKQPTGCFVYYRTPARTTQKELKHTKPNLHVSYIDTKDVDEAISTMMEVLHESQEVFLKPILVKLQGGKA